MKLQPKIFISLICITILFSSFNSVDILNLNDNKTNEISDILNKTDSNYQEIDRVEAFESMLTEVDNQSLDSTSKNNKINTFIEEQKQYGFPITSNDIVYFIYRTTNTSYVSVFLIVFNYYTSLQQVNGTDLFYVRVQLFDDVRTGYYFHELSGADTNDPLNPNNFPFTCDAECKPENITYISELRMPKYNDEGAYKFTKDIGSETIYDTVHSSVYSTSDTNISYKIIIYKTPNTNSQVKYKSVYFGDGPNYLNALQAGHVLDFLVENKKIDPVLGIFVQPQNRADEYRFSKDQYADFIAKDLVPYIDANYNTLNESSARAHIGASYGGYFSAFLGSKYPDIFNLIGSQSGSFWVSLNDILQIYTSNNASMKENFRFYFSGGTYEQNNILNPTYTFVEGLYKANFITKFQAFHMGHDSGNWQAGLATMIEFLFSNSCADYSGSPVMYPTDNNLTNQICPVSSSQTDKNTDGLQISSVIITMSIIAIIIRKKRIKKNF